MEKTWMPMVIGVLDIVAGVLGLIAGLVLVVLGTIGSGALAFVEAEIPSFLPAVLFAAIAIPLFVIGALAIAGGIYALQRKKWGWALTGSIAALFPSRLLGIAAIILTVLSKNEFE